MFQRLRAGRPAAVSLAEGSEGDGSGRWGSGHKTGDPRRADRKLIFVLAYVAAMLVTVALIAVITLANMVPLQTKEPWVLFPTSGGEAFGELRPLRYDDDDTRRLVAEQNAMRYVKMRHGVVPDGREMNRRWGARCLKSVRPDDDVCGYMVRHSCGPVYKAFKEKNTDDVAKLIKQGITRRIEIEVEPFQVGRDTYEIRFAEKDFVRDPRTDTPINVRTSRFAATLWVVFRGEETRRRERFINPLGFKVCKYELAAIGPGKKKTGRAAGGTATGTKADKKKKGQRQ